MVRAAHLFVVASALPVPLLGAAVGLGAWASLAALAYLTLLAFVLDQLVEEVDGASEFPAADALSVFLAIAQLALLPLVVWRLAQAPPLIEAAALFLATGLFVGQIGNANAHELIHRQGRVLRALGVMAFTSVLFGHHASAHRLVHHVHVATQRDPNTARRGEGYYRFLLRAGPGSFWAGLRAETGRRVGQSRWRHPYLLYLGGAALCLALACALGGALGLGWYIGLSLYVQAQLLLSDYVQHYGLVRDESDGVLEPVGPAHSWNAPHVFTSHMMLHAPRHSAHHARPGLRYDALDLPQGAPTLPHSLPVMSVIALAPPIWRLIMARRLNHLAETR